MQASELSVIDEKSEDNEAIMSYQRLINLQTPFRYYGCKNTDTTSAHMTSLLNEVALRNLNLINYGRLKEVVGADCPGFDRYHRDLLEASENATVEVPPFQRLYHRCAERFAPRLEKTYTFSYVGNDSNVPLKQFEYYQPSDHDRLMTYVLGYQYGFIMHVSEPHEYSSRPEQISNKFSIYVNGQLCSPQRLSVKTQETTTELLVHRNLLALQVIQILKKNAGMFLQKTYTAAWEEYDANPECEPECPVYQKANVFMWLIFKDIAHRQSVVVIHGNHSTGCFLKNLLSNKDLPLVPIEEENLERTYCSMEKEEDERLNQLKQDLEELERRKEAKREWLLHNTGPGMPQEKEENNELLDLPLVSRSRRSSYDVAMEDPAKAPSFLKRLITPKHPDEKLLFD